MKNSNSFQEPKHEAKKVSNLWKTEKREQESNKPIAMGFSVMM